ncbi:hypothetical protein [Alkalicoccus halolimnae]|uniref:Uncharacterized protein n=1 Tax=Alkalicoccus halolimnae TaxID=1667239 RepID=A0A5C7FKI8_9BACI|nr:hypothetical protein [Alkalicoccus halolimnae]TXF85866.1 hypothetical protein FTX54_07245 [Alkalicoccus halolimnae]
MQKLLLWVGLSILIGWIAAMSINYGIYNESTDPAFISPFIDGIIFMVLMVGLYFYLWRTFMKNPSSASLQMTGVGVLAIAAAVFIL